MWAENNKQKTETWGQRGMFSILTDTSKTICGDNRSTQESSANMNEKDVMEKFPYRVESSC